MEHRIDRLGWRIAAVVLVACVASPALAGVWGAKSRSCPRLESKLAALEANPATDPNRLARVRRRVADRCVALKLSTDYPVANPAFSPYAVQLGDGPARCNPINAPAGCRDDGLE